MSATVAELEGIKESPLKFSLPAQCSAVGTLCFGMAGCVPSHRRLDCNRYELRDC